MQATLQLNLGDALSASELRDLSALAAASGKTIERILFEAAKSEADRIRRERESPQQPAA